VKKILVVEDDSASLMLITEILRGYDYHVVTALDGQSALDVAVRENPDLIILDVMLPSLNGYQVCERLRGMPRFRKTPIIILTVLNEDSHRIRAVEAGANGFLSKPFKRVELITRIKALLPDKSNAAEDTVPLNTAISSMLTALELRCAGSTMSSRRCADLAERLGTVMGIPDGNIRDLRRGLLLRDIGLVACGDVSLVSNDPASQSQHSIRGLQIVGAYGREVIDVVVRYHHCTLKSEDYPEDLSPELLACVRVAIVCNRLEELLYGNGSISVGDACATLTHESEAGLLPKEEVSFITRLIST